MRTLLRLCLPSLCLAGLALSAYSQSPGIADLHRLDLLPSFKSSIFVGSISSHDRTGGNDDGFSGKYSFVRREPGRLVLADLKGPGVIWRIWTPTPTEDTLEFYFDGEDQPRVSLPYVQLFLGKHPAFPAPLSGFGAGGYYCYKPIPFARSCVVKLKAENTQFYQINYSLYPSKTELNSFAPEQISTDQDVQRTREMLANPGADLSQFAAGPAAKLMRTAQTVQVPANSSALLFKAKKGGRIVGLRLSPASALASKARDLTLRIRFDGDEPSVLCPVGDFFGNAWGQPAMKSALVGTDGETNYCYLPMPYAKSATIELVSERSSPVTVQAEVIHATTALGKSEGVFRAVWRRENPTKSGAPFEFIRMKGRGHVVGFAVQAQGFESGKTLYFEGDDQTTLDGELRIHGTGSEDAFNGGWYDVPDRWEKRLSFPLSGCLGYAKHLGRTGGYRFLLGDAYVFSSSILHTIEHSGEKNNIPTDHVGVTYLYTDTNPVQPLPPLADRSVVELKELVFPAGWQTPVYAWSFDRASLTRKKAQIDNQEIRYMSLAVEGEKDWFGPHFFSPVCEVPSAGKYRVYAEVLKGPGQGILQLFRNENPAGDKVDLYSASTSKSGRLFLGSLDLTEGNNNLMLKLVGKNPGASGMGLDLINVSLVRE